MNSKLNQRWIPTERIQELVQLEPALVLVGLSLIAWLGYKFFLREVSEDRHKNLRGHFKNLSFHLTAGTTLFLNYYLLTNTTFFEENVAIERISSYVGLLALFWGCIVFVKVWRILVFEYMFLSNMKVAVPLLLVNLMTLAFSVLLACWLATEIFSIKIAPLLATSAVFSLVLGLALQDTLGNLFSGVALQFDKPYEIGDWIEVQVMAQKWVGQVQEISWRATVLTGLSDEAITIPNRVVGSAQISNFSIKNRPILRSQNFRIPFGSNNDRVKTALIEAAASVKGVRTDLSPIVQVTETTESWANFKLLYSIDDYGAQWGVGDRVITAAMDRLKTIDVALAHARIEVIQS